MLGGLLTFVGILLAVVWLIAAYNQLVALRQRVTKDWAELDRLLRQRHDELSQLGELCARHLESGQPALERLADARSAVFGARHARDAAALGRAERELRQARTELETLAAQSPELAASAQLGQISQRVTALDAEIAARRDLYNASAGAYNVAIEEFPGRVVAAIGGFAAYPPLDFEPR
ncbi:MAG TPA: LemA family protein [Gammaproteobacteria bacterium]|jgi:LemA protein|nr:LemA family protein [Gammaproteobacteria bacterium]